MKNHKQTPRSCWLACAVVAAATFAGRVAPAQRQADREAQAFAKIEKIAIVERNVMAPMRDGVRLATDILRPRAEGAYPVVLSRTPYNKKLRPSAGAIRRGYAIVVQDVRGRYASEGEFDAFFQETNDGYDTVEWLAKQPWCNGKVGMRGGSYVGFTQLAAALARPPHLCCISPTVPPADFENRTLFYGGALRMELCQGWLIGQSWRSQRVLRNQVPADELKRWTPYRSFRKWCTHMPLADPGPLAVGGPSYVKSWRDMVDNWEKPGKFKSVSAALRPEQIEVPVLMVGGFYDIFAQENIELLLALRTRGSKLARKHSHLLMGPWPHGVGGRTGDVDFSAARDMLKGLDSAWLDYWLKGEDTGVASWPAMKYFLMGADQWVATDSWPPANSAAIRLYLTPGGLRAEPPAEGLPASAFTYDPSDPVPTIGGCNLTLPKGIKDHRPHCKRKDVAVFETAVLESDLAVVGSLGVLLYVSSSTPDTDFTAMLLDVRQDGYRANVQDGIVRLRYREGRDKPQLVEPGAVVKAYVDLWSTAYVFKAGHRVALHVSSSNFPRFDRNPNLAMKTWSAKALKKAENRIYHDARRPSCLELSLVR